VNLFTSPAHVNYAPQFVGNTMHNAGNNRLTY